MPKRMRLALASILLLALPISFFLLGKTFAAPAGAPLDPKVAAPAEELSRVFIAVAERVKPSVVSVFSEKMVRYRGSESPFGNDFLRRFFGDDSGAPQAPPGQGRDLSVPIRGMGSGMILDHSGAVLTNYHVVKGFDEIKIQLPDGAEFPAQVKGFDSRTDVAVLSVKGKLPEKVEGVALGDSDKMKVGELVLAVGAPFGLPQTVTQGIISATGRAQVGISDYEDFLQTDTAINPGNSGGPLVNMRGEVVGINSAIATSVGQFSGVGFSIPINMVKAMLPILLKGGKITRGQLGVEIQDLTAELAEQFHLKAGGALISGVNPGSPAQKSGLQPGDVILSYGGKPVESSGHLRNLVAGTAPGTQVQLELMREGKKVEVSAVLGKLEEEAQLSAPGESQDTFEDLGLEVQDISPQDKARLQLKGGIVVSAVQDASPAALGGILPDDVILQLNRQSVGSVKEFRRLLRGAKRRASILFLVRRQNGTFYLVVHPK